MGDTGSLTLGGVICVFAILIHKELLLPILCALFYIEDLSVILQVAYFKRTGGGRIFKMTPAPPLSKDADPMARVLIKRPMRAIAEQKIVTRLPDRRHYSCCNNFRNSKNTLTWKRQANAL